MVTGGEVVQKRVTTSDRTLGDESRTVCPICPVLKEAVPVDGRRVGERVGDVDDEAVVLVDGDCWAWVHAYTKHRVSGDDA